MAFKDELIIKLRADAEERDRVAHIDLSKEQILYGEPYQFAPRQFFDDYVELMVPESFSLMPEDAIAEKYLAKQKPQVILTDQDYTIDITLNLLADDTLKPKQIPLCLQTLKSAIREAYPATLFYDEGQVDANGKTIAYIDYKSASFGGAVYNIMFASAIHKRPFIGAFNCPFEQWEQWRPVILEMLKTVREIS